MPRVPAPRPPPVPQSLQLTTAGTICNRWFLSAPPRHQAKMPFDEHGHIRVTPRELERQAFSDPDGLINHQLLPGTPWGFPTYEKYARFIDYLTSQTGIHPHNFLFRGSTKIGFSISPNRKSAKFGDDSVLVPIWTWRSSTRTSLRRSTSKSAGTIGVRRTWRRSSDTEPGSNPINMRLALSRRDGTIAIDSSICPATVRPLG